MTTAQTTRTVPATMRAAVSSGGTLRLANVPVPQPQAGERLIEITRAGVNFIDTLQRNGYRETADGTILGWEAVGRAVDGGERYVFFEHLGAYADFAAVPAEQLVRIPPDITDDQALALFQAYTAAYLTDSVRPPRAGENVLVYAAAGGVGLLLTQLVAAAGARAIGLVSREAKMDAVRQAGGVPVLAQGDVAGAIRAVAPAGVDVVFNADGRDTWATTLAVTKRRGHIVLYGREVTAIEPVVLRDAGSLTLSFVSLFDHLEPGERETRVARIFDAMRNGALRQHVDSVFPLERVAEAHALIESRASVGKIVLAMR